jgi:alpha-N-acetylglucosaminidase
MYDLVDVKRQVISDSFMAAHQALIEAFKNGTGSVDDVATASETLLNLIVKMEFVLQVDNHFSMDKWVEDAQAWADGVDQVSYFTYQAVNQLTWWGEAAEISDYAAKHWSGLVGKYYLVRWHTYTTCLQEVLQHKAESEAECSKRVLDFESAFQTQAWKPQPAPELTWAQKLQRIASA